jgi:3-oxoacyl-[acyl-carrier-protein] synthase-3
MIFSSVSVASVAHIDAPHRVTSRDLEDRLAPLLRRLGIAPGIIASLSGIEERRFWDSGVQPSEAATMAAEKALRAAGIDRERVGVLVSTSVCRDFVEPSVASLVHRSLRLARNCRNFDLGNACLGFLDGMEIVAAMIERGAIDFGLVVDGESSRFAVERTIDRLNATGDARTLLEEFATLTLGSGAAAMLLARRDLAPEGHVFRGSVALAATDHNHLCRGQNDRMVTDAQRLLTAGLELAQQTFELARTTLGWSPVALDEVVMHQVSRQHTERLTQQLGIAPPKVHAIYREHGNVGPASVPMVLAKSEELGRLRQGMRVGLMGIGSGLNCAMGEIVW